MATGRARGLEIRVPSLWRHEAENILGLKYPELAAEAMEALLALRLGGTCITADRDYRRRARRKGRIVLLSEWVPPGSSE